MSLALLEEDVAASGGGEAAVASVGDETTAAVLTSPEAAGRLILRVGVAAVKPSPVLPQKKTQPLAPLYQSSAMSPLPALLPQGARLPIPRSRRHHLPCHCHCRCRRFHFRHRRRPSFLRRRATRRHGILHRPRVNRRLNQRDHLGLAYAQTRGC